MTLSNQTKGATRSTQPSSRRTTRITQSSEHISEISEYPHFSSTDARFAFSMVTNSIKIHLLQGHHVNLGCIGILSTCTPIQENEKTAPVHLIPSQRLIFEL